jgi:glycosyltransferase involved in cell wall biosynthesis
MKAVVVGSMNCMPTEYAILLKKYCEEVIHFYDADKHDALSNPTIRWGERSKERTQGISLRRVVIHHHLSYLFPRLFHFRLISRLNNADLIVLSGPSISLARLLKKPGKTIIALSYGNDISLFCNPAWPEMAVSEVQGMKRAFKPVLRVLKAIFVGLQINGLRSCTHYSYFIEGIDPEVDSLLKRILVGINNQIRLPRYSINTDTLQQNSACLSNVYPKNMYKILFPVRFSEGNELIGDKGWRILFDGLKKYRALGEKKFVCVCFKKGAYSEAQSYAREIGIDDCIAWQDVVPFDTLVHYYRNADVVIEQLGTHIIGQGLYAMALGKPVVGRVSTEKQIEFFKESGLLSVDGVDSLVTHLVECESESYREKIGKKSREFVLARATIESEFRQWGVL